MEIPHRPADEYFETRGVRLRFRAEGRGPPVVLVHGWTLDLDMWQPQVDALRESFRFLRWDRRGFGLSSGMPGLGADVEDVRNLCRHLGIGRAAFVGASQGARVVRQLAGSAPESVSCIVFDGAPDLRPGPGPGLTAYDVPVEEFQQLFREHGIDALRDRWTRHPLARLRSADPAVIRLLNTMISRYRGTDLAEMAAGPRDEPDVPALAQLPMPALVINGERDVESRRAAGQVVARLLPYAEYALVPGAGHLSNLDNPQHYNTLLRSFLARHAWPGPVPEEPP